MQLKQLNTCVRSLARNQPSKPDQTSPLAVLVCMMKAIKEYWYRLREEEFTQRLPLLNVDVSRLLPLHFHVDGVKVYRTQKAFVYSYSSALSKGPVLESKIVLALLRENTNAKPLSHDRMGEIIGYICQTLQSGRFPAKDFDGNPFAPNSLEAKRAGLEIIPGWRFCFGGFKGDLEARVIIHKFPRNYMSNQICEHCAAGRKVCHFQDFRRQAPFFEATFTHADYLIMTPERKLSSWLAVPGWSKDRNLEAAGNEGFINFDVYCCASTL